MHSQLLQVWHYQGHQTLSWLAGSALMTWLASRWWTMIPLAHAGHVWERQQADQTSSLFESMACMSLWCPGQPFEIWHSQDDLNIVRGFRTSLRNWTMHSGLLGCHASHVCSVHPPLGTPMLLFWTLESSISLESRFSGPWSLAMYSSSVLMQAGCSLLYSCQPSIPALILEFTFLQHCKACRQERVRARRVPYVHS